ncbi:XTP/dITP diphosphatase [Falseniella ignava]|uniref:dITP/XTP pyrophosphatase n=1 Tax=Falseniella ignava CCUG 37419 TaxID=883112 RepID=K1MLN8_9LACT|nr:XTP/dITP diphosphatase [Falseniella ignava]EKB56969.1 rdgB/HAM1 family non-canonical purine NTP pyrophosphatase [Falseniella ignava CCUG 37419]
MKIIIASHNEHKIKEFIPLLEPFGFEVTSLLELNDHQEIIEDGDTFEANALIKAKSIAEKYQAYALADDSGLVVPAIGNEPGIYSARYSGEPKDDHRNNLKLLERMTGLEGDQRKAYFVSHLVVYAPNGAYLSVEGKAEGLILEVLQGDEGFGYDPLFYYPPAKQTFAQMPLYEKNKVSHRRRAIDQLQQSLPTWLEGVQDETTGS